MYLGFLAQVDPQSTADALGKAESVQEILSIGVGLLLGVVFVMAVFYVTRWTGLVGKVRDLHTWHKPVERDGVRTFPWIVPVGLQAKVDGLTLEVQGLREELRLYRENVDKVDAIRQEKDELLKTFVSHLKGEPDA